ncbi:MAG: hypothetical protein PHU42_02645 [Patescibacteria group bacterium]|nr:hypothetical protein [Patescibacteria group bacterium]
MKNEECRGCGKPFLPLELTEDGFCDLCVAEMEDMEDIERKIRVDATESGVRSFLLTKITGDMIEIIFPILQASVREGLITPVTRENIIILHRCRNKGVMTIEKLPVGIEALVCSDSQCQASFPLPLIASPEKRTVGALINCLSA